MAAGARRADLAAVRRDERRRERPDAGANLGRAQQHRTRSGSAIRSSRSRRCLYRTAIDNYDAIPKIEGVGQHRRQRDVVQLRHEHAVLRQDAPSTGRARFRARSSAPSIQADLQHRRALRSCRTPTQRSRNIEPTSHFTPVSLLVRTSPFDGINGNFRTDYDGRYSRFRSFSSGTPVGGRTGVAAGRLEQRALQSRRAAAREHAHGRTTTSTRHEPALSAEPLRHHASINWDVKNQSLTQHRIASYYNAQCCGFSAEYQFIDLTALRDLRPCQQDSRFHFSVTLGGIGNVSNIFGAMGGNEPEVNSHAR